MKSSAKNQIEGTLHGLKRKVNAQAGQATNNLRLAVAVEKQKVARKVQEKASRMEKIFEKYRARSLRHARCST